MSKVYTEQELFDEIVRVMGELFEIDPSTVTRESRLVEDLDLDSIDAVDMIVHLLDSIDAVDMIVHLQNMIGRRIKPEAFKSVRTVGDVIDVIVTMAKEADAK